MKIKTDSILVCLLLILPIFSAIDIFDSLNIIENKDYFIGLDNFGTQNQYKNKIGVSKDSDYSNLYNLPLEKNPIEDFSFDNIKLDVGESNETHIWIEDPTNRTEGYFVEKGSDYQELNASRGQTNRHWYNETSNEYTFNSDLLVNKTGVVDNTDWITREEYPYRFIVRLTNGEIYTFDNSSSINDAFGSVDNSTIWAIGIETFDGIFAFYMNPDDITWGHAQYIYYPYLLDGTLPAYNQPLYQIFPHLYVNNSGTIYDAFITNRDNYNSTNIPIDHFTAFNESDVWGMYYTISVNLLSSEWIIKNGFKYNFTDNLFHQINEIQCISHDFDDIGMAYEITSTSMSDNTPYQPNRFVLSNDTHSVIVNISEAWEAGEYLEDFYSQIGIVSQNNQSFVFSFDDMELAGFTEKYLNLHNQSMPDGSYRLTLRAGMYGYGSYIQGTIIEIDPDVETTYAVDGDDINWKWNAWVDASTFGVIGLTGGNTWHNVYYLAFDTGINLAIDSFSANSLQLYVIDNTFDSGEGVSLEVYNIVGSGDGRDSNTAYEGSASYVLGTNSKQDLVYTSATGTGSYQATDSTKTDTLLEYWADNRGSSENYISWRFSDYGGDNNEQDDMDVYDAQQADTTYDPKISATYALPNSAPTAYYHSDADSVHYAGKEHAFRTSYFDDDGASDLDEVYASFGDANNDIQFYVDNIDGVSSSGSASVLYGVNYLVGGTATYSRSNVANGYVLNWTYTIDWDWDHDDSAVIDYFAYCTDDSAANSGWSTNGEYNYNYENDLILYSLDFNTDDSTGNEDQTADLNAEEWFRGGIGIRGTGVITYEGTTDVYPETTDVNAQLWTDGSDRFNTYDDAPDDSGVFETPYYPTSSATGLNITYALDIVLDDIPSTGSEGTGVEGFNTQRDNEIPTGTSYTHYDVNSGDGYTPQDGYDDDLSADYTVNSPSDGSGCGLHVTAYAYEWNDGGFGSYTSDSTPDVPVMDGDSADSDIQIRDKVNNVATIDGEDIVIDDDAPYGFSVTWARHTGWIDSYYAYLSGSTIYFNSVENNYFTLQVNNDGNINNSGFWKIEWDKEGIFETPENDSSGLPDSKNFYYLGDSSGSFIIRIINNAGNYGEIVLTATEDIDKPLQFNMGIDSIYHQEWEDITVYMSTTDAKSGILNINGYEWWVNPTRDYGGTVYTTTGIKTWTGITEYYPVFYGVVWDNVGNYRNASIMGTFVTIIIIINPVDEIEEIIIGGFYNEEDVYYDYPSKSVSILVEENTEDEINLIENITMNHTVILPVFDDDAQNASSMTKNNIIIMNIIRIIPEPQWLIFMIFLQTIVEFRRRHKKRG